MSLSWKSVGPISPHHFRYSGCHCSSARSSRLSWDRSTLFGILEVRSTLDMGTFFFLRAGPIEAGALGASVEGEGALLPHRVGALEDPVLPGGQPAEDLGLHGLGAGEAEVRLHAGERVGGDARPLLH